MLKITYFGTTTLLFDDGKDQILFDANFTRPPVWKYITGVRVKTDTGLCDQFIRLHHMDRLRAIFISHTHYDHVLDAPYLANRCNAVIYGSRSAKNVAAGGGVPEERIVVFSDGSEYSVGEYKIRIIKSLHAKPVIFNNDLEIPVKKPLVQPAPLRDYKEGGSYDFFIEHKEKKLLIHPGCNYIEGKLDNIRADVLFLGIAGLPKLDAHEEKLFFEETAEKTKARLVIPVHWDDFFLPLAKPAAAMSGPVMKMDLAFFKLAKYCEAHDVSCLIQYPHTSIKL